MSQEQYLKYIKRELHAINKRIDYKILHGLNYKKEAEDHKLLLRKIRQHTRRNFLNSFLPSFF